MKSMAVNVLDAFSEDNRIPLEWVKESWYSILCADNHRGVREALHLLDGILENLRYAQDKMIACNYLVSNLMILHNVDYMSKAINKLKRQGFQVDAEALHSLSPYRTEHINLLGTYSLKIRIKQGKRNFRLI